jgi:hypothetical protein
VHVWRGVILLNGVPLWEGNPLKTLGATHAVSVLSGSHAETEPNENLTGKKKREKVSWKYSLKVSKAFST